MKVVTKKKRGRPAKTSKPYVKSGGTKTKAKPVGKYTVVTKK